MADPRYRYPPPGPRSPTFNPTRTSLPTSVGYSSLYAGDMHVMPHSANHPVAAPRGYSNATTASGVPTTTRTYQVVNDPRARPPPTTSSRDPHRRRSTLDAPSRPPVIVTTTAPKERGHGTQNSRLLSPVRDDYRASEPQMFSQPAVAPPSTTLRSRSTNRPSYATSSSRHNDDYSRSRDRENSLSSRDAEAYRSARPSVTYPSDPRHSSAVIDYGDDGYEYTNAGQLARWDLDHARPPPSSRRRESQDRGYYRPNISYNADARSFNVNKSPDLSRNYGMNTSRPLEGSNSRGGGGGGVAPSASTRGFDRIGGRYDPSRDSAGSTLSASHGPSSMEVAPAVTDRRDGRRARPVSLYQDREPRSSHLDEFYHSREDERNMREIRERGHDRNHHRDRSRDEEAAHEPSRFQDGGVASRGFGVRTDAAAADSYSGDRREPRREPRRPVDDEGAPPPPDFGREDYRSSRLEPKDDRDRRDKRDGRSSSDDDNRERSRRPRTGEAEWRESRADRLDPDYEDPYYAEEGDRVQERSPRREQKGAPVEAEDDEKKKKDKSRFRDKAATGLGIAATGLAGLGLATSDKDQDREKSRDQDREKSRDREARRKPSPGSDEAGYERKRDAGENTTSSKPSGEGKDRDRDGEKARDKRSDQDSSPGRYPSRSQDEAPRNSRQTEVENHSASDSDRPKRRGSKRPAFNPNNTMDLNDLKDDLAALNMQEKEHQDAIASGSSRKGKERDVTPEPIPKAEEPARKDDAYAENKRASPPMDHGYEDDVASDSRGRELMIPETSSRTVRVVSPPRDKSREKPLKGILKQPKASFPEEVNPVREGVAPHKDDKKAKDVPPGARWTKISRKIVNPEALSIGKERFEVRDDFCMVLRVLSKDEIQAYAAATQVLRERRQNGNPVNWSELDRDRDRDDSDHSQDRDEDDRRSKDKHPYRHRYRDEHQDEPEERERELDRRRRHHRRDEEDDYESWGNHR